MLNCVENVKFMESKKKKKKKETGRNLRNKLATRWSQKSMEITLMGYIQSKGDNHQRLI